MTIAWEYGGQALPMWLRRSARSMPGLCSLALITAMACVGVLALAPRANATGIVPPDNPTANYMPSSAAEQCADVSSMTPSCSAVLLAEIDRARAAEGVGPITLPISFGSLSTPEQLLTLTNLERADRGLSTIAGLSPHLDVEAREGAETSNDPNGPEGFAWGSNWSDARSTLYDDLGWMYDDGPGSYNVACTYPEATGCWGHRDNILRGWEEPVGMGAGAQGSSQTQLFVSAYPPGAPGGADAAIEPIWSSIVQTLPVGLAPSSVVVLSHSATNTEVMMWASGEPMDVHVAIGTGGWSVAPTECNLPAGSSCRMMVVAPASETPESAAMTVDGPNGPQSVTAERHIMVHMVARPRRASVGLHELEAVAGQLTPVTSGQRVLLELRRGRVWATVASTSPEPAGRFTLRVRANTIGVRHYRAFEPAQGGYEASASRSFAVSVTAR